MTALPPALTQTGITYRQLDHWTRKGHLKPMADGGTGAYRWWPAKELAVAALMHRLVTGGLNLNAAAVAARDAIDNNADTVELPNGLTLHIHRNTRRPTRRAR